MVEGVLAHAHQTVDPTEINSIPEWGKRGLIIEKLLVEKDNEFVSDNLKKIT